MSDPYVIQRPRSVTNPTGRFRLLRHSDWSALRGGCRGELSEPPVEFDTYDQARLERDDRNDDVVLCLATEPTGQSDDAHCDNHAEPGDDYCDIHRAHINQAALEARTPDSE